VAKEDLGDARLLHAKTFLDLVQILSKGELQNRVTIFFSMYSSTDLGLPRHRIGQELFDLLVDSGAVCLCRSTSTVCLRKVPLGDCVPLCDMRFR
jgi:hypothetical protein